MHVVIPAVWQEWTGDMKIMGFMCSPACHTGFVFVWALAATFQKALNSCQKRQMSAHQPGMLQVEAFASDIFQPFQRRQEGLITDAECSQTLQIPCILPIVLPGGMPWSLIGCSHDCLQP